MTGIISPSRFLDDVSTLYVTEAMAPIATGRGQ